MTVSSAQIVRILRIVDTRQYEEQDDRWVPIPGSGDAAECTRCRRLHEVHATVELSDGTSAVVGTGCAERGTMDPEVRAAVAGGDRAAKRLGQLRAQLAGMQATQAKWNAAWSEVMALPLPPVRVELPPSGAEVHDCGEIAMGDASIPLRTWTDRAEREECLISAWRMKRMEERRLRRWKDQIPPYRLKDVEISIGKLLKRLPVLA